MEPRAEIQIENPRSVHMTKGKHRHVLGSVVPNSLRPHEL